MCATPEEYAAWKAEQARLEKERKAQENVVKGAKEILSEKKQPAMATS